MRVCVMGAGSWGTVFAMILADAGNEVVVWSRGAAIAEQINEQHENQAYHSGIKLPESITATTDAAAALAGSELVVLAIPAQTLRTNLAEWSAHIEPEAILVSLIKGIELGTVERMSEVIAEVAGIPTSRVAVVSGPNLAHEIALRQPAATTVACSDVTAALKIQAACTTDYFRPYHTTDVVGVEIAGAVKNVIALANGLAVGLGYGENAQSALMTRGLVEMARLGEALGANPLTFTGLAGVGDLIATCQSPLSRNRTFGVQLGEGKSLDEAQAITKTTSEGVKSCKPILDLATRNEVEMPITAQVVKVIHEGLNPASVLRALMSRPTTSEQGHE